MLLHYFVIISFIKTITCTTQIHQPITFDLLNISQSLRNGRSVWSPRMLALEWQKRYSFVKNSHFFHWRGVFSGERRTSKGMFKVNYLKPDVESEIFPLTRVPRGVWGHLYAHIRFWDSEETALYIPSFPDFCETCNRKSRRVRSPDRVTWLLPNVWTHTKPTIINRMFWILWYWMTLIVPTTSTYISDFLYRWPEIRSISWPLHYRSMEKYWNPSN